MKTGILLAILAARLVAIIGIFITAVPLIYSSPQPFPWGYLAALVAAVSAYAATYFYGDYLTWIQSRSKGSHHDQELFKKLLVLFPPFNTPKIYGGASFGGHFPEQWFTFPSRFADQWDSPNRMFLDRKLERFRRRLHEAAKRVAAEMALRTVPTESGFRSAKEFGPGPQPPQYLEDVRCIEKAARVFAKRYEQFVRLAYRRLEVS